MFAIQPGDSMIVLCDRAQGIALVKADVIEDLSDKIFPKGEKYRLLILKQKILPKHLVKKRLLRELT